MIEKFPHDEVIKKLESLEKGDDLIVRWRDACGFRDVPVPEEIYYTPKETRGAFYALIDNHLILISEVTGEGTAYEGTVIPVGVIEDIEVVRRRKRGKKKSKKVHIGNFYPVKIVTQIIKVSEKCEA